MSHKIAHIPLDFPCTASMCGDRKEPPMDAIGLDATIKTYLTDVRAKLEKALRIAKAAETCAGSGRTRKGMEIVLSLEPIVYELNTLLNAASMNNRPGKS
jgi:hypothetical protein